MKGPTLPDRHVESFSQLEPGYGFERLSPRNLHYCLGRRELARAVAEACRSWKPGDSLLDVGCGAQPYRKWVEERGLSYTGVDWTSSMHVPDHDDTIRWDLNVVPWPLADAAYDAILGTEVLEHVPDPPRLMAECARVCRPGGMMLLTSPMVWPEHEAPNDYHRFTRFGLCRLCEQAGFQVERLEARGGWPMVFAQLIGFKVNQGRSRTRIRLTKVLAWPVVAALTALDRRGHGETNHPLTLGYSVYARRAPSSGSSEPAPGPWSPS
jgi:SAM-dependent methyltransferase